VESVYKQTEEIYTHMQRAMIGTQALRSLLPERLKLPEFKISLKHTSIESTQTINAS